MMKYSSFSFLFFYNFCFLLQRLTSYINQFFSDSISFQLNIFKFFFVNVLNLLSLRLCFIVNVGSKRHMKEAVSADHKSLVLFFYYCSCVNNTNYSSNFACASYLKLRNVA